MLKNIKITWTYVVLFLVLYGAYRVSQGFKKVYIVNTEITEEEEKLAELQDRINKAKDKPRAIEKEREELEALNRKLRDKKSSVPTEINVTAAMKSIFAEIEKVGLKVISVSPNQNEVRSRLFASLEIRYNIEGAFLQFLIFLDRVSKLEHLVGVSKATMSLKSVEDKALLGGSRVFTLEGKNVGKGNKYFHTIQSQITLVLYRVI